MRILLSYLITCYVVGAMCHFVTYLPEYEKPGELLARVFLWPIWMLRNIIRSLYMWKKEMKISRHDPKGNPQYHNDRPYTMVQINKAEALALIESLSRQVRTDNPNAQRPEIYVEGGDLPGYFSIAVIDN